MVLFIDGTLTQLASADREVPVQNDPLLNALGIGRRLLVDSVDPLLDGGVDGAIPTTRDLRDARGFAAQPPAELHGLWRQLILRVARLCVHLALRDEKISFNCTTFYYYLYPGLFTINKENIFISL